MVDRGKSKILVTDSDRGSALSIIRSLGRSGRQVVAAAEDSASMGLRSRYAHERLIYPSPASAPDDFVRCLESAVREMGVDLIIPVTDDAIMPLSRVRERFEGVCKLAIADADALEATADKLETFRLAQRLDIPAPRTYLVHEAGEAIEHAREMEWPVVLKPRRSRSYRGGKLCSGFRVAYAGSADEIGACFEQLEGRPEVLLQEYFSGVGEGVELLLDRGRPLAAFQHQRLREVPVHGGASALRRSVPLDPDLYAHSVRLMSTLSWTGLAMVEFKVAAQGARLMEINGRVWGSLPLAVHSGVDFPARLADLMLYGPSEVDASPEPSYEIGVYSRNLELELMWIASVLRGGRRHPCLAPPPRRWQALRALFQLLKPSYKFDVLSLEDFAPARAEVAQIFRKFRTKLGQA